MANYSTRAFSGSHEGERAISAEECALLIEEMRQQMLQEVESKWQQVISSETGIVEQRMAQLEEHHRKQSQEVSSLSVHLKELSDQIPMLERLIPRLVESSLSQWFHKGKLDLFSLSQQGANMIAPPFRFKPIIDESMGWISRLWSGR